MERELMLASAGIIGTLGGLVGGLVGGVASTVVNPILDAIGHAVGGAAAWMVRSMATFWINTPTPQLTTGASSQTPSSTVAFIQGHLWWYMTGAAVVGVLIGCGRMVWEQRADAGREVVRGLAVFAATAGAGLTVIALATTAADQFASWIINASAGGNFGTEVGKLTTLTVVAGGGLSGVILVCVFGFLLILASLIQMVLMIVRGGMLVLLAGVLPTTAAFTSTQAGRQWFRKSCGWLVAFILYKPAAAIVYATAFSLSGNGALGAGSVTNVITGLMLVVLAILALPALMKFVAPMVGATAAGGAGAVLAGAAGAAAGATLLGGPTGALRGVGGTTGGAGGPVAGPPLPPGSSGSGSGSPVPLNGAGGSGVVGPGSAGSTGVGAGRVIAGAGVAAAAAASRTAAGAVSGAETGQVTSAPGAGNERGESGGAGHGLSTGGAGPGGAGPAASAGPGVGNVVRGAALGAAGSGARDASAVIEPSGAGEASGEGMA